MIGWSPIVPARAAGIRWSNSATSFDGGAEIGGVELSFGKTQSMLPCFDVPSTIPTDLLARDGFFEPREKSKYLDVDTLGLEGLQPIEIPQNGQSFLWKSLEKNSRDLEKLGEKLGGCGTPPSVPYQGAPCRARVPFRSLCSAPPRPARNQIPINLKAAVGAEFSFRLRAPSIPGCVSLVSDAEERARDGL